MKINKLKFFTVSITLFFFVFSFSFALAYEPIPTHRDLTKKIIEVYNKYYEPKISEQEAQWIMDGTVKEDIIPRWINHFYDPIYNQGWTGEKEGDMSAETVQKLSKIFISTSNALSSVNWLHNQDEQWKYGLYEGNQTYDRALKAFGWAENIKNKNFTSNAPSWVSYVSAYKALGHTLHLLEDLGVPAHTRGDTHADVVGSNDNGDPYETWVAEGNNGDLNFLNNLNLQNNSYCSKINECFINLAKYSNENFYSKDTIDDLKYSILKFKYQKLENNKIFLYREDNFGNNYIFKVYDNEINKNVISNPQVHKSYWQLLSKQIVLSGVQVIKQFREDARDSTENLALNPPSSSFSCDGVLCKGFNLSFLSLFDKAVGSVKSVWGQLANTANNLISAVKGVFASNYNDGFKQIGEINLETQTTKDASKEANGISTQADDNKKSDGNSKNDDREISKLKKEITSLKKEISALKNGKNQKEEPASEENSLASSSNKPDKNKKESNSKNKNNEIDKNEIKHPCFFNTGGNPSHSGMIINEIAWMGPSTAPATNGWS
ncbi:MAG: hypothetical protein QMD86_00295 [Patescibacteria group bacterium]|nr:hypothetical protein [Patescibacteria group bacterium]